MTAARLRLVAGTVAATSAAVLAAGCQAHGVALQASQRRPAAASGQAAQARQGVLLHAGRAVVIARCPAGYHPMPLRSLPPHAMRVTAPAQTALAPAGAPPGADPAGGAASGAPAGAAVAAGGVVTTEPMARPRTVPVRRVGVVRLYHPGASGQPPLTCLPPAHCPQGYRQAYYASTLPAHPFRALIPAIAACLPTYPPRLHPLMGSGTGAAGGPARA